VIIGVFGLRLARVVNRLADRTGLGEAIAGAMLLAGANSLGGMVVSIVTAAAGDASLAISNSVGGIAAQTAFIVVADSSTSTPTSSTPQRRSRTCSTRLLMIVLLAIVVLGAAAPPFTVLGVHPATPLLLITYGYGLSLSRQVREQPMWHPEDTSETVPDVQDTPEPGERMAALWVRFGILAVIVTIAGWVIARAGLSLIAETRLTGTIVGAFFTGIATSVPELVTAVAAVRSGALTLAVGGIVGGNTFDMLFIAAADVVYQEGSLYEAIVESSLFVLGWTMLLVGIVGAGHVRRERSGIGFEGIAILTLYLAGLATITVMV
jgi:cation:H+ antiporter